MAFKWNLDKTKWKCCGKSRGQSRFCPECGSPRPQMSPAEKMLEYFQAERDEAESHAKTFAAKLQSLLADADALDPNAPADVHDWHGRGDTNAHQRTLREIEVCENSQRGWKNRADKYGDWVAILSELMVSTLKQ